MFLATMSRKSLALLPPSLVGRQPISFFHTSIPKMRVTLAEFGAVMNRLLGSEAIRRRFGFADVVTSHHSSARSGSPSSRPVAAVGVDGSPESLALCVLLQEYSRSRDAITALGHPTSQSILGRIVGITVDPHGTEATKELTRSIKLTLQRFGIDYKAVIVNWSQPGSSVVGDHSDPPVEPGEQTPAIACATQPPLMAYSRFKKGYLERLSMRKYNLLARSSKEEGAEMLFLGHHMERLLSHSLPRIASLPSSQKWNLTDVAAYAYVDSEVPVARSPAALHLGVLRPLLGFSEERLRATCDAYGISWRTLEDNPFLSFAVHSDRSKLESFLRLASEDQANPITKELLLDHLYNLGRHSTVVQEKAQHILENFSLQDPPTGTSFVNLAFQNQNEYQQHWMSDPVASELVLSILHRWCSGESSYPANRRTSILRSEMIDGQLRLHSSSPSPQIGPRRPGQKTPLPKKRMSLIHSGSCTAVPPRKSHTGADNWVLSRGPLSNDASHIAQFQPTMLKSGDRLLYQNTPLRLFLRVDQVGLWDNRFYVSVVRPKPEVLDPSSSPPTQIPGSFLQSVDLADLLFVVRPFLEEDYRSLIARLRARIHNPLLRLDSEMDDSRSAVRPDPTEPAEGNTAPPLPQKTDGPMDERPADEARRFRLALVHYMTKMPNPLRSTIPCVALVQDSGDVSHVLAVPSLNVNMERGLLDFKISLRNHPRLVRSSEEVRFQKIL
ncbi:hypothetical protein DFJ73DRAFT_811612 [Zopfochytrium polystomum]|nr:hypothetical protein DFJ73DRAFT_811612 [Zopfochytrium polystomum]